MKSMTLEKTVVIFLECGRLKEGGGGGVISIGKFLLTQASGKRVIYQKIIFTATNNYWTQIITFSLSFYVSTKRFSFNRSVLMT